MIIKCKYRIESLRQDGPIYKAAKQRLFHNLSNLSLQNNANKNKRNNNFSNPTNAVKMPLNNPSSGNTLVLEQYQLAKFDQSAELENLYNTMDQVSQTYHHVHYLTINQGTNCYDSLRSSTKYH